MTEATIPPPEMSRPFLVKKNNNPISEITIESTPAERDALARRFDLVSLNKLSASLSVEYLGGDIAVRISGTFSAQLVQTCIVSLETVPETINGTVAREFVESSDEGREVATVIIDPEADDPPDLILEGQIDLGEIVSEHLGLEINPFPRASGVEFGDYIEDEELEADRTSKSPFAVLKEIQEK